MRSPLRYPGGKSAAAEMIVDRFPPNIRLYAEPFVGGGSVYLAARSRGVAKKYMINDRYRPLVAFYKTLRDSDTGKFVDSLYAQHARLSTTEKRRNWFRRLRDDRDWCRSDWEAARAFWFLNRVTYSGTIEAGGFTENAARDRYTLSAIHRVKALVEADMFEGTRITCLDFKKFFDLVVGSNFMFLDPPYATARKLYGKGGRLHDFDHEGLAESLKKMKSPFLMTYDDCRYIRDLYRWARIVPWEKQYGMSRRKGDELFIQNYQEG